jgi:hypothetical protein
MSDEIFSPTSNHQKGAPVGGVSSAETGEKIVLRVDPVTKRLLVDASITTSTGIMDGEAIDANNTGTLAMGTDGTNYQVLSVDSTGRLYVNINGTVTVQATNLDIRDLVYSQDSVAPYGSQNVVLQQKLTSNDLIVTLDGESVAVTNADITTIAGAIAGTEMQVDVLTLPAVTATNLDIRDLTSAQDSIAAVQSGAWSISVSSAISGISHGVATVTTAGTDVALAGSTACKKVVIQAQTDNTSLIAVGGSGVDATEATGTGVLLYPGDVFELEIDNLADIFIDSLVSGEGVRFTYFT